MIGWLGILIQLYRKIAPVDSFYGAYNTSVNKPLPCVWAGGDEYEKELAMRFLPGDQAGHCLMKIHCLAFFLRLFKLGGGYGLPQ